MPKADAARVLVADRRRDRRAEAVHPVRQGRGRRRRRIGRRFLWRYNAPRQSVANCSMPIRARRPRLRGSRHYGTGGGLRRGDKGRRQGSRPRKCYFTNKMQNHHGGMVLVGWLPLRRRTAGSLRLHRVQDRQGRLGRTRPGRARSPVCRWPPLFPGRGTGSLCSSRPIRRSTPEGRSSSSETERSKDRRAWAYPVIANGKLYVRDQELMHCYDIKADKN